MIPVGTAANGDILYYDSNAWQLRNIGTAGQVLTVGQEASSLTGILGLVTAGVGITIFCGMPRFCGGLAGYFGYDAVRRRLGPAFVHHRPERGRHVGARLLRLDLRLGERPVLAQVREVDAVAVLDE